MAVTSTADRSGPFTPNSVTTVFPFTFIAASTAEVRVFFEAVDGTQTDAAGYNVTLNADHTGQAVFDVAPLTGAGDLYIESVPDFTQDLEFVNQGPFLAQAHEEGFDRSAIRDLYLKGRLDQAILVGGDGGAGLHGEGFVAIGVDGAYLASGASSTPVSNFMTPSVAATSQASFFAAFGNIVSNFISFASDAANAVVQSLFSILLIMRVTPYTFGAVGNGAADDTAALNRFFAAVAAGKKGHIPKGTFKFTSALTAFVADNINVTGEGHDALLLYTGAATNLDLLTCGDGVNTKQHISLRGFRIDSTTALTGGQALHMKACIDIDIDLVFGIEYGTWRIYRGLWLDGCSVVRLHSSGFFGTNAGLVGSNFVEVHMMDSTVKGQLVGGFGSGIGILVGGGSGGLYSENLTQIHNDIAVRIDTSITGTPNTQFFFDGGTFDTNKTACLYINDPSINMVGKFIRLNAWFASSNSPTGAGVINDGWGGTIDADHPTITNHTSSGIYNTDANTRWVLGKGANISNNGGYGFVSTVALTLESDAAPFNNTLGAFGGNPTIINTQYGSTTVKQDPTTGWMFQADGAVNTLTVANGGNAALAAGSGLVIVSSNGNGITAAYLLGGNAAALLATTGATLVAPTTTPAAGTAAVAYSAGSYRLYNNIGVNTTFTVAMANKTRASN